MTTLPAIEEIDTQLAPVLRKMEARGICLDVAYLEALAGELKAEIDTLQASIWREAGHEFTIDSPRQLAAVIYDELGLADGDLFIRKNKSGKSTAASELSKLVDTHPIIQLVLDYREKTKLLRTYVEPLPKLVGEDDRVHTTYRTDTASGRLSSKDPNLQNIPVRTEEGKKIRRAFVAAPGTEFLAVDYSQIELRIAAHLSGDANLIAAFQGGDDIHASTAKQMGVDRRVAKAINFGVLFGQGAFGLSEALHVTQEEARAFIDQYFQTYSRLHAWISEAQGLARERGYAETMLGRKRFLGELKGRNAALRAFAERVAVNHPIQGTEAEIISLAMLELDQKLTDDEARMLLQVHDELIFEVPAGTAAAIAPKIQQIMTDAVSLDVPIVTEAKSGPNWAELTSLS